MRYNPQPARAIMRERNNMTIRQLAELARVDFDHVSNVLKGYARPCPELLRRMPYILQMPIEDLLTPELLSKEYAAEGRGKPRRQGKPVAW